MITSVNKSNADKYSYLYEQASEYLMTHDDAGIEVELGSLSAMMPAKKVEDADGNYVYKRLDPTKPSYTVTGSGGGGTHIYHWSEPRALTNRERARLQTFPDTYEFIGSKESVRKQIGMAVPCKGAKIIFEAILKSFAGIKYESIEPSITE